MSGLELVTLYKTTLSVKQSKKSFDGPVPTWVEVGNVERFIKYVESQKSFSYRLSMLLLKQHESVTALRLLHLMLSTLTFPLGNPLPVAGGWRGRQMRSLAEFY